MFKQASKTPALTFAFEINVNVLYDEHRVKMPEWRKIRYWCLEMRSCWVVSELAKRTHLYGKWAMFTAPR